MSPASKVINGFQPKFLVTNLFSACIFQISLGLCLIAPILSIDLDFVSLCIFLTKFLILIGLLGSVANLLLTQSYKLAEVTLTTPLKYLSLVFAIIIGFYFFNEIPTIYTLSGAALIVVSSAIIFFRESELKKPITLPRQQ